ELPHDFERRQIWIHSDRFAVEEQIRGMRRAADGRQPDCDDATIQSHCRAQRKAGAFQRLWLHGLPSHFVRECRLNRNRSQTPRFAFFVPRCSEGSKLENFSLVSTIDRSRSFPYITSRQKFVTFYNSLLDDR